MNRVTLLRCTGTPLTEREIEVLLASARGECGHGIAHRLQISYHTVRSHKSAIMVRLDARSMEHALALWVCTEEGALERLREALAQENERVR